MFYKLPLDEELDKDIIDWIASFPRNRKSEVVRQVLRSHINGVANDIPKATPAPNMTQGQAPTNKPSVMDRFANVNADEELEKITSSNRKPNDLIRGLVSKPK